jgi:hypothetical protein
MKQLTSTITLIVAMLTMIIVGCNSDKRLAEMAERNMERQAAQNRQVAEMQKEVAEGSRLLVEAEAEARKETLAIQRELQAESAEIGHQRDSLEDDRRRFASQRHSDPIIAAAISTSGVLLACALPLVICWLLLRFGNTPADDQLLNEILLEDLVATPRLLPSRVGVRSLPQSESAEASTRSETGDGNAERER